jgi:hypothetical protein
MQNIGVHAGLRGVEPLIVPHIKGLAIAIESTEHLPPYLLKSPILF